jgi:undecaprenyl diphosphate synthase
MAGQPRNPDPGGQGTADETRAPGVPRHVAIIMDGNGRWARQRGLSRTEGHRAGAERVKEIVDACLETGVEYLTLYAFSKENWTRPDREVSGIMQLSRVFFRRFFRELRNRGVYFVHLGEREGLPRFVVRIIEEMERENIQEGKLHLCIAFNYSGRSEIARAAGSICSDALQGRVDPAAVDEALVGRYLYTAAIPDPDLLIRTGGEMRVSNFLLWQIAYTELWVTGTLWPDFRHEVFLRVLEEYAGRERRFGGV